MSDDIGIELFDEIVREVAEAFLAEVQVKMKKRKWSVACWDARFPAHGAERLEKYIVYTGDNAKEIRIPASISFRLDDAIDIRDKIFPKRWYGLMLKVYPDGRWEREFNYDSKWLSAPGFFPSVE